MNQRKWIHVSHKSQEETCLLRQKIYRDQVPSTRQLNIDFPDIFDMIFG